MLVEFEELREYRNVHDWTWDQLVADMKRAGVVVSARTVAYLCDPRHLDVRPLDRTLYKIRKYLATIRRPTTRDKVRADKRRRRDEATA